MDMRGLLKQTHEDAGTNVAELLGHTIRVAAVTVSVTSVFCLGSTVLAFNFWQVICFRTSPQRDTGTSLEVGTDRALMRGMVTAFSLCRIATVMES